MNYRTVGAPEDGDYIDEEHFYEYDPNGNILHVNTGRWKRDGVERELSREEKFRWDEENRLMAISQDGYVSNYWYDGDGERVIKEHGGNQAVYVNSGQDGVLTDTRQFTIYPSAYLTVHNGSWYTKHIYIGSERISSRMGTMLDDWLSETFEANAILAGENVFEEIDYDGKCDTLARVMRSNYAYFDLPYNGYNRHGDEMVSTPPRSGDSGILGTGGARHYWMMGDADAADADTEGGGPTRGPRRAENVNYNGNRYFYHSDHLGSSSLITDASGNVTQQLDYQPYGEVFLEKRSTDQNVNYFTPYKFNGKELDEETGLYYYGARYMNPRLSIWYATDPQQEKYPDNSSYCFTVGNPTNAIDFDGESTHTDKNGRIVEVYRDIDYGVYRHNASYEEVQQILRRNYNSNNTSAGGRIMGSTYYWDEFVSPETGRPMYEAVIKFGERFCDRLNRLHSKAMKMNLYEIAKNSMPGGIFDIKKAYGDMGALLNGKYVSARSAGNFLAGYNAQSGNLLGFSIDYNTFQMLAGALHIESSNKKALSKKQMVKIVFTGSYSSSEPDKFIYPTYGEVFYQYRMSQMGWEFGETGKSVY